MCRFHVFGAFWSRFGFLGIRAKLFCDAACAVGCVSELRARDALNHAKRTSDATGIFIQPEDCQKARPEAQAGCQGLNIGTALCDEPLERFEIRPSGFKISGIAPGGSFWSTLSIFTAVLSWFRVRFYQLRFLLLFPQFLFLSLGDLGSMDLSLFSLQILSS